VTCLYERAFQFSDVVVSFLVPQSSPDLLLLSSDKHEVFTRLAHATKPHRREEPMITAVERTPV